MTDLLIAVAHATAIAVGFALDDPIILVAQPRLIRPDDYGGASPILDIQIVAKAPTDPAAAVQRALDKAMVRVADNTWHSNPRGRIFSRAVQRFVRARLEADAVNRYLEYCLTCELLVGRLNKPRPVDMRIRELIAPYLAWTSRRRRDALWKALRLKHLEEMRNQIVHGAVESVDAADLEMVSAIATTLILAEMGQPYGGNKTIDAALRASKGPANGQD
jgi:Apea-like HEPN